MRDISAWSMALRTAEGGTTIGGEDELHARQRPRRRIGGAELGSVTRHGPGCNAKGSVWQCSRWLGEGNASGKPHERGTGLGAHDMDSRPREMDSCGRGGKGRGKVRGPGVGEDLDSESS